MGASVTVWEATAPVKLPTSRGPPAPPGVRPQTMPEWYFTVASTTPARVASQAPTYPPQREPMANGKLQ